MQNEEPDIRELEETINRYKRTVYGIAVTQLNSRSEADDVFQEVFLLYYQKKPEFDIEEQKRAWLIRTAVNICRRYNFGKWSRYVDKTTELEELQIVCDPGDREVYAAVRELPPKLREAVYLHHFLGMDLRETADILGIGVSAVSMRLSKARGLLQNKTEG
ncbi:sigma-70 family RNA polymerase sigma factor [Ruminococcus sp.]|uniref:RNA polymerase sigma factor n=1 Tax=Ruminococcus sp. TaxID=41978 RepID=UPI0025D7A70D|nr:sigma-70 family RNA polymerase sigma factor [Ruminococcus sp.]MBQ8966964.1 sigma-70 family RNA polymerase sigma factor [Ruminococcus sp.]